MSNIGESINKIYASLDPQAQKAFLKQLKGVTNKYKKTAANVKIYAAYEATKQAYNDYVVKMVGEKMDRFDMGDKYKFSEGYELLHRRGLVPRMEERTIHDFADNKSIKEITRFMKKKMSKSFQEDRLAVSKETFVRALGIDTSSKKGKKIKEAIRNMSQEEWEELNMRDSQLVSEAWEHYKVSTLPDISIPDLIQQKEGLMSKLGKILKRVAKEAYKREKRRREKEGSKKYTEEQHKKQQERSKQKREKKKLQELERQKKAKAKEEADKPKKKAEEYSEKRREKQQEQSQEKAKKKKASKEKFDAKATEKKSKEYAKKEREKRKGVKTKPRRVDYSKSGKAVRKAAQLGGFVWLMGKLGKAFNIFDRISDVGMIAKGAINFGRIAAHEGLGSALDYTAMKGIEPLRKAGKELGTNLKKAATGVKDYLKENSVLDFTKDTTSLYGKYQKSRLEGALDTLDDAVKSMTNIDVKKTFKEGFQTGKKTFEEGLETGKKVIEQTAGSVKADLQKSKEAILDATSDFSNVQTQVKGFMKGVESGIKKLGGEVIEKVPKMMDTMGNKLGTGFTSTEKAQVEEYREKINAIGKKKQS